MEKKKVGFVVILIVVIAIAAFVTFFYKPTCDNIACWEEKLQECKRAKYISNPIDVTWEYKILGEKAGACEVDVTAIIIKRGLKKSDLLEDKSMTCLLPLGSVAAPESNPNFCTGPLKEAMQELIIQKLHEYVLENIGQIDESLKSI